MNVVLMNKVKVWGKTNGLIKSKDKIRCRKKVPL